MADGFDELVDEATRVPADTWDFGWLEGRATEERPSWHYFDRVGERVRGAQRLLDIDTGTGNMLVDLPHAAPLTVATDAHEPSIQTAGLGSGLVAPTSSTSRVTTRPCRLLMRGLT